MSAEQLSQPHDKRRAILRCIRVGKPKTMKLIKLTKLNFDGDNRIEESIYYVNVETISTIKTHTKVTNDKPIGEYTLISWVNTTSSQWWVKEDLEGIVAFINK